ncbi:MAG: hypothetical protein AAF289_00010 [Cyanobacteria bacterium P01_A01_bin.135]
MMFPIWQYLDQPLWDRERPSTWNPVDYWRRYRRQYLNRCHSNAFLEQCWQVNYPDFVNDHRDFCHRNALEEDPRWLLERCWCWQRRRRRAHSYQAHRAVHPENHDTERES